MSKIVLDDRKAPTQGQDISPFKAFLRERWAGLLVAAIIGYLVAEYLRAADWSPRAAKYLYPIWVVRDFTWITWIPLAAVLFVFGLAFDWVFERITENNYKTLLIGRYLRRRRIAWVSLIAVTLCTYMVLVVISVMGGWLDMFKKSFRGLSGDIIIEAGSLRGFPFYEQIIEAIKKDPDCQVEAAMPAIETGGLINFGHGPVFAQVLGIPIDEVNTVNRFSQSLFRQHTRIEELLKNPSLSPEERAGLERKLHQPPSFDLLNDITVPLSTLPPELKEAPLGEELARGKIQLPADFPPLLKGRLRYDKVRKNLVFSGKMMPEWNRLMNSAAPEATLCALGGGIGAGWNGLVKLAIPLLHEHEHKIGLEWKALLKRLSPDPSYQKAIDELYLECESNGFFYPGFQGKYNGLIVGNGVIGIHRNRDWQWQRPRWEFSQQTTLTMVDVSNGRIEPEDVVTKNFFIVDDSHLGVWQYDQKYVYVALDQLQKDLRMEGQREMIDGKPVDHPGRVTNIHVRLRPGIDLNDEDRLNQLRDRIFEVALKTIRAKLDNEPIFAQDQLFARDPELKYVLFVRTWQDKQRIWISAIENEKLMLVILFGVISVVAVFLIFCIFYMIVAEKTKDVGIIKSEGATSVGVAGIFLGYGLVIGIVGSGLGLLLSYVTLHNINELHTILAEKLGVQVWNPEVYVFDKIPSSMSGTDVAVIIPIAILASVLGAVLPAIRAGRMNPVEALRWE